MGGGSSASVGSVCIPTAGYDEVELHVLGCRLTYQRQTVTSACAWFSVALRPQKP